MKWVKQCFISMLGWFHSLADFGCGKNLIFGRNVSLTLLAVALGGGDLIERERLGSYCFR